MKCSRFRKSELHKVNLTGEERTSPLGHKLWHKLRADEGHVQAHPGEGSCSGVKVKDKELWCWCCSLTVTRKDVQTLVSTQKGLWFCSVASISLPSGRGEGLQPSCSAFQRTVFAFGALCFGVLFPISLLLRGLRVKGKAMCELERKGATSSRCPRPVRLKCPLRSPAFQPRTAHERCGRHTQFPQGILLSNNAFHLVNCCPHTFLCFPYFLSQSYYFYIIKL